MYQAALDSGGSIVSKKIRVSAPVCVCVCVLVARSCPTLCDPMDCSLPDSSAWDSPGKSTGVGLPFPSPGPALE